MKSSPVRAPAGVQKGHSLTSLIFKLGDMYAQKVTSKGATKAGPAQPSAVMGPESQSQKRGKRSSQPDTTPNAATAPKDSVAPGPSKERARGKRRSTIAEGTQPSATPVVTPGLARAVQTKPNPRSALLSSDSEESDEEQEENEQPAAQLDAQPQTTPASTQLQSQTAKARPAPGLPSSSEPAPSKRGTPASTVAAEPQVAQRQPQAAAAKVASQEANRSEPVQQPAPSSGTGNSSEDDDKPLARIQLVKMPPSRLARRRAPHQNSTAEKRSLQEGKGTGATNPHPSVPAYNAEVARSGGRIGSAGEAGNTQCGGTDKRQTHPWPGAPDSLLPVASVDAKSDGGKDILLSPPVETVADIFREHGGGTGSAAAADAAVEAQVRALPDVVLKPGTSCADGQNCDAVMLPIVPEAKSEDVAKEEAEPEVQEDTLPQMVAEKEVGALEAQRAAHRKVRLQQPWRRKSMLRRGHDDAPSPAAGAAADEGEQGDAPSGGVPGKDSDEPVQGTSGGGCGVAAAATVAAAACEGGEEEAKENQEQEQGVGREKQGGCEGAVDGADAAGGRPTRRGRRKEQHAAAGVDREAEGDGNVCQQNTQGAAAGAENEPGNVQDSPDVEMEPAGAEEDDGGDAKARKGKKAKKKAQKKMLLSQVNTVLGKKRWSAAKKAKMLRLQARDPTAILKEEDEDGEQRTQAEEGAVKAVMVKPLQSKQAKKKGKKAKVREEEEHREAGERAKVEDETMGDREEAGMPADAETAEAAAEDARGAGARNQVDQVAVARSDAVEGSREEAGGGDGAMAVEEADAAEHESEDAERESERSSMSGAVENIEVRVPPSAGVGEVEQAVGGQASPASGAQARKSDGGEHGTGVDRGTADGAVGAKRAGKGDSVARVALAERISAAAGALWKPRKQNKRRGGSADKAAEVDAVGRVKDADVGAETQPAVCADAAMPMADVPATEDAVRAPATQTDGVVQHASEGGIDGGVRDEEERQAGGGLPCDGALPPVATQAPAGHADQVEAQVVDWKHDYPDGVDAGHGHGNAAGRGAKVSEDAGEAEAEDDGAEMTWPPGQAADGPDAELSGELKDIAIRICQSMIPPDKPAFDGFPEDEALMVRIARWTLREMLGSGRKCSVKSVRHELAALVGDHRNSKELLLPFRAAVNGEARRTTKIVHIVIRVLEHPLLSSVPLAQREHLANVEAHAFEALHPPGSCSEQDKSQPTAVLSGLVRSVLRRLLRGDGVPLPASLVAELAVAAGARTRDHEADLREEGAADGPNSLPKEAPAEEAQEEAVPAPAHHSSTAKNAAGRPSVDQRHAQGAIDAGHDGRRLHELVEAACLAADEQQAAGADWLEDTMNAATGGEDGAADQKADAGMSAGASRSKVLGDTSDDDANDDALDTQKPAPPSPGAPDSFHEPSLAFQVTPAPPQPATKPARAAKRTLRSASKQGGRAEKVQLDLAVPQVHEPAGDAGEEEEPGTPCIGRRLLSQRSAEQSVGTPKTALASQDGSCKAQGRRRLRTRGADTADKSASEKHTEALCEEPPLKATAATRRRPSKSKASTKAADFATAGLGVNDPVSPIVPEIPVECPDDVGAPGARPRGPRNAKRDSKAAGGSADLNTGGNDVIQIQSMLERGLEPTHPTAAAPPSDEPMHDAPGPPVAAPAPPTKLKRKGPSQKPNSATGRAHKRAKRGDGGTAEGDSAVADASVPREHVPPASAEACQPLQPETVLAQDGRATADAGAAQVRAHVPASCHTTPERRCTPALAAVTSEYLLRLELFIKTLRLLAQDSEMDAVVAQQPIASTGSPRGPATPSGAPVATSAARIARMIRAEARTLEVGVAPLMAQATVAGALRANVDPTPHVQAAIATFQDSLWAMCRLNKRQGVEEGSQEPSGGPGVATPALAGGSGSAAAVATGGTVDSVQIQQKAVHEMGQVMRALCELLRGECGPLRAAITALLEHSQQRGLLPCEPASAAAGAADGEVVAGGTPAESPLLLGHTPPAHGPTQPPSTATNRKRPRSPLFPDTSPSRGGAAAAQTAPADAPAAALLHLLQAVCNVSMEVQAKQVLVDCCKRVSASAAGGGSPQAQAQPPQQLYEVFQKLADMWTQMNLNPDTEFVPETAELPVEVLERLAAAVELAHPPLLVAVDDEIGALQQSLW